MIRIQDNTQTNARINEAIIRINTNNNNNNMNNSFTNNSNNINNTSISNNNKFMMIDQYNKKTDHDSGCDEMMNVNPR